MELRVVVLMSFVFLRSGSHRLQSGKDRLLAGGADNFRANFPIDEVEQGRDELNAVPHTQPGILVSIDLDELHVAVAMDGNFVQRGSDDPAGLAPSGPEAHQDRLLGFQNFHLELRLVDFWDWVHIVGCHKAPKDISFIHFPWFAFLEGLPETNRAPVQMIPASRIGPV